MFDSIIKKVNNFNIIPKHLLLKAISKKFNKKKVYLTTLIDFRFKILVMQ